VTTKAPFRTFITPEEFVAYRDESWVVVDARFDLGDPEWGLRSYQAGHVPGAVFADLNVHMSGRHVPGETGRRPLPDPDELAATLRSWGVSRDTQVVIYDGSSGRLAAARLWVLLRWLGHARAAVMAGGFPAWTRSGLPVETTVAAAAPGDFAVRLDDQWIADVADVATALSDPGTVLMDARPVDVYAGTAVSFDPIAGHIPGARCLPLDAFELPDGGLHADSTLRQRFSAMGALDPSVQSRIAYCGSGVWAAQLVLIMTHLGIGNARLYVGSFSEWLVDDRRPTQSLP
jgi:thiosulfate/3-mercaptopyruvate sulfurtransferase